MLISVLFVPLLLTMLLLTNDDCYTVMRTKAFTGHSDSNLFVQQDRNDFWFDNKVRTKETSWQLRINQQKSSQVSPNHSSCCCFSFRRKGACFACLQVYRYSFIRVRSFEVELISRSAVKVGRNFLEVLCP